jgi:FtsP/CotA-like multicopper oxidase with cupredoxin domain
VPARVLRAAVAAAVVLAAGFVCVWVGRAWNDSRVPGRYDATALGPVDLGGGALAHHHHGGPGGAEGVSVAALRERGTPDVRFTLTAGHATVRLPSGRSVHGLAFDGRVPGPELRVRQGDLVQVTLVNRDVREGVSIHWHGVDVPNGEDGVSGMTQDAVPVGGRFTYRFRAEDAGTYWYHSHQHSADEVRRGLFGALVVAPRGPAQGLDLVVAAHQVGGPLALFPTGGRMHRRPAPGTSVRLRLLNADDHAHEFGLGGTTFRVVGIDGRELEAPALVRAQTLAVPAGGRYDVAFTMPRSPVTLGARGTSDRILLGRGEALVDFSRRLDLTSYRAHAPAVPTRFDRTFRIELGRKLGFFHGGVKIGRQWSINGKIHPHMPMLVVAEGEVDRIVFVNRSGAPHPMHLHGHHMLVMARDGRPVTTPWLVDSLDVGPGERWDVAFRTDNPGIWMLHCHNLPHAAKGLVTHLAYEGVHTPYRMGSASGNEPE